MELFENRSIIDQETFQVELKQFAMPPFEKFRIIMSLFGCLLFIAGCIVLQNIIAIFAGIMLMILLVLSPIIEFKKGIKIYWARIKESTGASEIETQVLFTPTHISVINVTIGGLGQYNYDVIVRFAETKNLYALYTRLNQCIVINKISLENEKKTDEFISFLRKKCTKIRWR